MKQLVMGLVMIGLIIAFGKPKFEQVLQYTRETQNKATIHSIEKAADMYKFDKGKYPTTAAEMVGEYLDKAPHLVAVESGQVEYYATQIQIDENGKVSLADGK